MQIHLDRARAQHAYPTRHRAAPRLAVIAALIAAPVFAVADGVHVRFDFSSPATSPFPSDRYTQPDWTQNTFKRVNLPKPDCAVRPSDCADIDVINTLDGFNTQPRISVPFTGDIDLASVTSDTVYLVNLGDTLTGLGYGQRVGINQVAWDAATKTLVFESDQLLQQHSRYVLVVTDGVRDTQGEPIERARHARRHDESGRDDEQEHEGMDYRKALADGERAIRQGRHHIVAASLFTTLSISADLQKIHRQIAQSQPAPADFMIGNGGTVRAVFPLAGLAAVQFVRETGTAPAFTPSFLPTPALSVVPGSIGRVAFGTFNSPNYENAARFIPATAR